MWIDRTHTVACSAGGLEGLHSAADSGHFTQFEQFDGFVEVLTSFMVDCSL